MTPRVRSFRPHARPAVLEIVVAGVADQARLATELGLPPGTSAVDHGGSRSADALRDRPGDCYVAEVGGAVVGFMRVGVRSAAITLEGGRRFDRYLVVAEVDVDAAARGQGVGTRLLAEAERIAPARGCALVGIRYLANNRASAGIARRRDFTLTREGLPGGQPRSGKVIERFKLVG